MSNTKGITVTLTADMTAFALIGAVYSALNTTEERDNWHHATIGKENSLPAVLREAVDFGISVKKKG